MRRMVHIAFGAGSDGSKLKVKIILHPLLEKPADIGYQQGVLPAVDLIASLASDGSAVDRGHLHSSGRGVICLRIRAAPLSAEPGLGKADAVKEPMGSWPSASSGSRLRAFGRHASFHERYLDGSVQPPATPQLMPPLRRVCFGDRPGVRTFRCDADASDDSSSHAVVLELEAQLDSQLAAQEPQRQLTEQVVSLRQSRPLPVPDAALRDVCAKQFKIHHMPGIAALPAFASHASRSMSRCTALR